MHRSWVHFVREPQGFQNTRTLFFERVTAVTEYYGVLERVVQPKEKSYEVGAFRDEASCFLGVSSYVNDTFWKNGMVFQSLFHELVPLPASRDPRIWAKFARGSFAG